MRAEEFEYEMMDVPIHDGRPAIDPILNTRAREGWSPVTIISPSDDHPAYSIVFKRALPSDNPYDPTADWVSWARWERLQEEERRSNE